MKTAGDELASLRGMVQEPRRVELAPSRAGPGGDPMPGRPFPLTGRASSVRSGMASDVAGTPAAPEAAQAPPRGWFSGFNKGLLWALLELFVLTGFVVAQPLLDVTGKAPDFFIFRRADRLDILLLIGVVTLLPALYLWVFELITSLAGERARQVLHLVIVTALLAVLAMEVGKKLLPLRGKRLAVVAAVVALAIGFVYLKQAWLRLWLRYLAPAPLVFALLFATTSPSAKLLLPTSAQASAAPVASSVQRPPIVMVFFDEFPLESLSGTATPPACRATPPGRCRPCSPASTRRRRRRRSPPSTPTTCSPSSAAPTTSRSRRPSPSSARSSAAGRAGHPPAAG
jgi:hypothetical protein